MIRHALITGASRGIGRGIALKLAGMGVHSAIHYFQNRTAAEETLEAVRSRGGDGFTIQADVTRMDEVEKMVECAASRFGSLDLFVSNARPEPPTFYYKPLDLTLPQWDSAMDSQGKAFLTAAQAAARHMQPGGRIIAISARGGTTGGWQPWAAMGAGKAALESLCRYFAVALAPRGITVNALVPGPTDDGVFNTLPDAVLKAITTWHEAGWTPGGRLTKPVDVAGAVAMLCSADASWVTGQVIAVDGGASLMEPTLPLDLQRG